MSGGIVVDSSAFLFRKNCVYSHHQLGSNTMKKQQVKLIEVANHMGLHVLPDDRFAFVQMFNAFGTTLEYITVVPDAGPNIWVWSVLHELGHAELTRRRERTHVKTTARDLKRTYANYKPTEAFYRDFLAMEWKAWEQGLRIARREGVNVNTKQYLTYAEKCWRTYVTYVRDLRNIVN